MRVIVFILLLMDIQSVCSPRTPSNLILNSMDVMRRHPRKHDSLAKQSTHLISRSPSVGAPAMGEHSVWEHQSHPDLPQTPKEGVRSDGAKICSEQTSSEAPDCEGVVLGQWGDWTPWSRCSRSCGGGTMYSDRLCTSNDCLGERRRYRVCNIRSCKFKLTFRDLQCKSTNSIPYHGALHQWKSAPGSDFSCSLQCVNEEGEVCLRSPVVLDGTPCKPGSRDMCIEGDCKTVGCDWEIGSYARFDACGICNGSYTACKAFTAVYTEPHGSGYVLMDTIPEGVLRVKFEELTPSTNDIAVGNETASEFYLNGVGEYTEQGLVTFCGVQGFYRVLGCCFEKLFIPGPTKCKLSLFIRFNHGLNQGVMYSYLVPCTSSPGYQWAFSNAIAPCELDDKGRCARCVDASGKTVDKVYCESCLDKLHL